MSGGHYDYQEYRIAEILSLAVQDCKNFKIYGMNGEDKKTPLNKLAKIYQGISKILTDNLYELDYHISGDSEIKNLKEWENQQVEKFKKLIGIIEVTADTQNKLDKIQEELDDLIIN